MIGTGRRKRPASIRDKICVLSPISARPTTMVDTRKALGGFLLAKGLPPTYVFLSACVFAAVAAIATAFLALPGRQPIRMAAMEVAS
jgi:hypothetical protein